MKVYIAAALLLATGVSVWANAEKAGYYQRGSARGNGLLTKVEVRGDMRLGTRFDDIDTNRDEIVTPQEMKVYIEKTYGVIPAPG